VPRRSLLVTAAALLVALAPACSRDLGPEATYRALARAVSDRDGDEAWALLSSASQKWLQERARRAAAAVPGVVTPNARQLLVGDAALGARPPTSIEVARHEGDRVILRVQAPGAAPGEVTLVREGGRWRVELPEPGEG
jgi:hypothetical protein